MGYWVNTTYIHHGEAGVVADALSSLCMAEGRQPAAPTPRERLRVEPMQYGTALGNDLWGLAVFPGAPSWTVVQSAPLELLAERASGAAHMRLADLCRRLGASAFQVNVYDSTDAILVESSPNGDVLLSGINGQSAAGDYLQWHGERLAEEFVEAQFRLHPFQDVIAGAGLGEDIAQALAARFGGPNASFCDNLVSVDTLITHKPFTAPGGVALYFYKAGT